jgi:hypothetical protein
VKEALSRFGEELRVPSASPAHLALREKAVEALIQAGIDAEKDSGRTDIGAVMGGLVLPARVVTAAMLVRAAGAFLDLYDDLAVDVPRAAAYFAQMLKPLVPAILPAAALPDAVAAAMGVAKPKAPEAAAPSTADAPAAAVAAAESEPAPAAGAGAEPAAAAAAAEGGDEAGKKKKKKAVMTFDE